MRQRLLWIILCGLLLAGCGAKMEVATAVPTRVLPTETAVPPTSTAIVVVETAVRPTETPAPTDALTLAPTVAHTSEPTATLTITSIPYSPPPGRIAFLWSPYPRPDGSDPSLTSNFYIASPGESIEAWQIEPVATNLFSSPLMRVSPDFSQAAILFAENEELAFNEIRKISTYDFAANEIQSLTDNQCCLYNFSWQPDSQAIIYSQVHELFVAPLNNTPPEQLTINSSLSPDSEVFNPIISPDGMRLAFTTSNPNSLVLYDLSRGEYATVEEISYPSSYLTIAWSPNSEWLAFTNGSNRGLSIVNTQASDAIELSNAETRCFPAWSVIASQLAFTCGGTLSLWDANSQTTRELASAEAVGPPVWSPTGDYIATSFVAEGRTGLWITEPVSNSKQVIDLSTTAKPAIWSPIIWSPDGEWLLFLSEQDSQSGYYIINRSGGEPYLILDTTGLFQPHDFVWLSGDMKP